MSLLAIDGLNFSYRSERTLKDILMSIEESEIVGLLGPNGSGKTTLIKCMNKILESDSGKIFLEGQDLSEIPRRDVAKEMGYVPQSTTPSVSMPTVYEVVMMGRTPHSMWKNDSDDEKIVWDVMDKLNVSMYANRGFNELSSGQVQRVLIARALAQEAKILLLDEPTSNLDVKYQLDVMNLIRTLVDNEHISACAIIHDLDLAARFCDRIVLMKDGEVKAHGKTFNVLTPDSIREIFEIDCEIVEIKGLKHVVIL